MVRFIGSVKSTELELNLFGWEYKGDYVHLNEHCIRSAGRIGASTIVCTVLGLLADESISTSAGIGCGVASLYYLAAGAYNMDQQSGQGKLVAGGIGALLVGCGKLFYKFV